MQADESFQNTCHVFAYLGAVNVVNIIYICKLNPVLIPCINRNHTRINQMPYKVIEKSFVHTQRCQSYCTLAVMASKYLCSLQEFVGFCAVHHMTKLLVTIDPYVVVPYKVADNQHTQSALQKDTPKTEVLKSLHMNISPCKSTN